MLVEKVCKICGKTFNVPYGRRNTAKYCSIECRDKSLHGENNVKCCICGKEFHLKPCKIKNRKLDGFCCSRKCFAEYKKIYFKGENNHQYGLKGELNASFKGKELSDKNHNNIDIMVYAPNHPFANKHGRVCKHVLVVEENYKNYNKDFFFEKDGKYYLKKGYNVHHIDKNHNNNSPDNLDVLTRSEHTKIHNKEKEIVRDEKTGRIITTVKLK